MGAVNAHTPQQPADPRGLPVQLVNLACSPLLYEPSRWVHQHCFIMVDRNQVHHEGLWRLRGWG